ncbi:MAG: hypothetical protein EXS40_03155 [Opitutaceae bacterium]|nr:hypothetical protein [Opitutaceae bacterium]
MSCSAPRRGRALRLVVCGLGLAWSARAGRAASFHVDSRGGDDARDGLAPERAWRSVERANAAKLAPGDRLLLRAGSVWEGAMLQPRGSGAAGKPIVLDRYGDGADPVLNGLGRVACALRLENEEHWEISNLEITNRSPTPGKQIRGVEIRAKDTGARHHIVLKNLFIHDVNAAAEYRNDGDTVAKSFGGLVTIIEGNERQTAWDDLRVEHCRICDIGPMGMVMLSTWMVGHREDDPKTWFPSRGVVVRGCTFERIARNGLLVRGSVAPLIEDNLFRECGMLGSGNAMFVFHCDDALVQFNESCFTRYNPGDSDAAGFDSDYNCRRSTFQFNYSHDNEFGFILICAQGGAKVRGFNEGTIIRHNISQNDGGNVFRFSGVTKGTRIYNNTIYTSATMTNPRDGQPHPPRIVYHKTWGGWSDDSVFFNNIIVNTSERAVYEFGESTGNLYERNLYFGIRPATEPADAHKLTVDPLFATPGGASAQNTTAAAGIASARAAYALRAGSPARGAGRTPEGAVTDLGAVFPTAK